MDKIANEKQLSDVSRLEHELKNTHSELKSARSELHSYRLMVAFGSAIGLVTMIWLAWHPPLRYRACALSDKELAAIKEEATECMRQEHFCSAILTIFGQ